MPHLLLQNDSVWCGVCGLVTTTDINESIGKALGKMEALCQKCGTQASVIWFSENLFCAECRRLGESQWFLFKKICTLKFNFNIILVKLFLNYFTVKIVKSKQILCVRAGVVSHYMSQREKNSFLQTLLNIGATQTSQSGIACRLGKHKSVQVKEAL